MPHHREHAFDRAGRAQVIPMLGREVVEGQQRAGLLGEAFDRSAVLGAVYLGEDVDRPLGGGPIRGPTDFAQVFLDVGLHRERGVIQDVDGLVVHDQELTPALRGLPDAALEANQLLLPSGVADQQQHALAFHARLQDDAIGPHIHVLSRPQIALLPTLILSLPVGCQPGDDRRRQSRRRIAQQGPQPSWKWPVEMPRRYSVGSGASSSGCIAPTAADRRAEPNPFPAARIFGRATSTVPCRSQLFAPGRNLPHDAGAPIAQLQILHRGKKRLDLDFHGLRQKLPRTTCERTISVTEMLALLALDKAAQRYPRELSGPSNASRSPAR